MNENKKEQMSRTEKIVLIFFVIIIIFFFALFVGYKFDRNVYKIKINDIQVNNSGIEYEELVIDYTVKDLLGRDVDIFCMQSNPHGIVAYPEIENNASDKEIADDEVCVSISTNHIRLHTDEKMHIEVGKNDNIVTFKTKRFTLKTKLIRNDETGEWKIEQ